MSTLEVKEIIINLDDNDSNNKPIEIDEDLEDGEIDDEDDDDDVVITNIEQKQHQSPEHKPKQQQQHQPLLTLSQSLKPIVIDTIDLIKDSVSPIPSPKSLLTATTSAITTAAITTTSATATTVAATKTKAKKSQPFEDDHAISIENALANVLKKQGIQPTWPKLEQRHIEDVSKDLDGGNNQSQSRSSRRRKRKKEHDQKEKDRDRKEKKKHRYDSPEKRSSPLPQNSATAASAPSVDDENDLDDDYEMLNVRGGSPPPIQHTISSTQHMPPPMHTNYNDVYDTGDDSAVSSYDSYDDSEEKSNDEERRRRRRDKKSARRKRERRNEKRNRHDSDDDKRSEPTKMELCKFYLLECCAKGNNCSYMHAEFPCKYYYLGMDCVHKEECKFLHGKPLNEQLRNILLKHLETAPKEILGNFKRIARESALQQMSKQHEKLCRQYNEQNTWPPLNQLLTQYGRRGGSGADRNHNSDLQAFQNQQQQKQGNSTPAGTTTTVTTTTTTLSSSSTTTSTSEIPSLLDMVIQPPTDQSVSPQNPLKSEKQRKSRWTDNQNQTQSKRSAVEPVCNAPSFLDLKNLTGILSEEHIEKLSELGITNLEQVNQLTFGQLNQIGLTIAEISEIQLNARNMEKLGINTTGKPNPKITNSIPSTKATKEDSKKDDSARDRDVDMRFLPSITTTSTAKKQDKIVTTGCGVSEKDATLCSNSNSNSSNAVVTVDLSQYLKEANLSFDRGDIYDDENDDEQLVIDDGNMDKEEPAQTVNLDTTEKKSTNSYDTNSYMSTQMQLSDITSTLKNPFKSLYSFGGDKSDAFSFTFNDKKLRNPFRAYADDAQGDNDSNDRSDDVYDKNRRSPRRKARSRSRTPTPTRSQSTTPEASQSSAEDGAAGDGDGVAKKAIVYERTTMYDYNAIQAEEDSKCLKADKDKDMRFPHGNSSLTGDIDLRLPFQPMTNYIPATEIDGSITSHLPITYKVYEVNVPPPNYAQLRQNFKSDQTTDPRLRRILGLAELSQTTTSAALSRSVRKPSVSIASPESDGASPKYYTPPSISSTMEDVRNSNKQNTSNTTISSSSTAAAAAISTTSSNAIQPRLDPRRAAARAQAQAAGANASSSSNSTNASITSTATTNSAVVEIRNLLQKSDWYKNLNSKFKIMVNQQLALVSTELKKFHQDSSPNKIFDISFIVNNSTLQQILTNLGIYIDDNGEVAHVDSDQDEQNNGGGANSGIQLPNLSQPPPNQQQQQQKQQQSQQQQQQQQQQRSLDFLRAPPPNMLPSLVNNANVTAMAPQLLHGIGQPPPATPGINPFAAGVQNARPSLLGLPPGVVNPFMGLNPNFVGAANPVAAVAGLLGTAFSNFSAASNMQQQQRNFMQNKNRAGSGGGGGGGGGGSNNRRSKKL